MSGGCLGFQPSTVCLSVLCVCVCFFEDVPLHGVFLRFEGLETQV